MEKYSIKAAIVLSGLIFLATLFFPIPSSPASTRKEILLATTTSTVDSGLLDDLVPIFQKETGYFVKVIGVGSGQALKMGERGEADVLLVHSPEAEKNFMNRGFGALRKRVMYNDFLLVGPPSDPARVRGLNRADQALKAIAEVGALFLSRGDDSGTHVKEKALWRAAGLSPEGKKWYQQTGLGMGHTLMTASEKRGYTLTDRGTFMSLKKHLGLEIMVVGDPILQNIYHLIVINPEKWPKVNAEGARELVRFLLSPKIQKRIGGFGADRYGSPLFFPFPEPE